MALTTLSDHMQLRTAGLHHVGSLIDYKVIYRLHIKCRASREAWGRWWGL